MPFHHKYRHCLVKSKILVWDARKRMKATCPCRGFYSSERGSKWSPHSHNLDEVLLLSIRATSQERHRVSNPRQLDCLFSSVFRLKIKKIVKAPHYWTFMMGIYRWSVNVLQKGPVMWKAFPSHNVSMQSRKRIATGFNTAAFFGNSNNIPVINPVLISCFFSYLHRWCIKFFQLNGNNIPSVILMP